KILTSRDAQKDYTHITAAALRAKDCILNTAQNVQESASDIYAEAQMINEERADWDDIFDDLDDELDDEDEDEDGSEDSEEK
ncbi:MAG: DUF6110 family protein, partial [Lachnospiraceae bacterium]|nr:DUF6110 family protein [Lachnospiraceae bacterium]